MENMEGKVKSIRMGLQGEVTPEFHLEGERGAMKGRWGRGREEWGFRPSTTQEQRYRGVTAGTLPNTTV